MRVELRPECPTSLSRNLLLKRLHFQGMFGNAFVEQSTGRDTFTFKEEEEHCSESEFRQFLHYVCGCRSTECFTICNAHDVITMLQVHPLKILVF